MAVYHGCSTSKMAWAAQLWYHAGLMCVLLLARTVAEQSLVPGRMSWPTSVFVQNWTASLVLKIVTPIRGIPEKCREFCRYHISIYFLCLNLNILFIFKENKHKQLVASAAISDRFSRCCCGVLHGRLGSVWKFAASQEYPKWTKWIWCSDRYVDKEGA